MKATSPSPSSKYVWILLLLILGYAPLVPVLLDLGDDRWPEYYANEAYAWTIIFGFFDALVVYNAITIIRQSPVLALASILFAVIPLALGLTVWLSGGLGPSSDLDINPTREMVSFWSEGGGFVSGLVFLPVCALYLFLRVRERTTCQPRAA